MLKHIAAASASAITMLMLTVATPAPAWADSCIPVPVSTTGLTVGAAGQEVRVPAITGVEVCIWANDSYGSFLPDIQTPSNCGTPCIKVVIIDWNWHWSYGVRYFADGVPRETKVTQPPITTGPPGQTCLFSIGAPADASCEVYVNIG